MLSASSFKRISIRGAGLRYCLLHRLTLFLSTVIDGAGRETLRLYHSDACHAGSKKFPPRLKTQTKHQDSNELSFASKFPIQRFPATPSTQTHPRPSSLSPPPTFAATTHRAAMDRTFDNLPYQIPGPAGGISYPTYSQEQRGELNKSDASRIFRQPSWRALLHLLRAPPFGASRLQSSVALLRSHALSDRFQRVSRLAVLVDALSWVGRDASVKLRDPTGVIRATIHAEVFDKWKTGIEHGAALLLDGVAAVAYVERRPKGFRTDAGEALHVSIQLCHVVKVFPVGNSFLGDAADVVVKEPRESYAPAAIAPPVVRRPPSRRPAAPPPPPRVPLRPRQEHHGNRSMRRPNSAGGYAPYRGVRHLLSSPVMAFVTPSLLLTVLLLQSVRFKSRRDSRAIRSSLDSRCRTQTTVLQTDINKTSGRILRMIRGLRRE